MLTVNTSSHWSRVNQQAAGHQEAPVRFIITKPGQGNAKLSYTVKTAIQSCLHYLHSTHQFPSLWLHDDLHFRRVLSM